ncbi:MAG: Crp/Fnr family transcriptional regulator [Gammaproteobacteria bacterium]|nr:Crp/Fnr family transcriptional regulator [Gammaproteobacteria bacterium]
MLVKQVPAIADVVLDAVTYKLLWDSFLIQLLGTRSVINRLASLLLQIAGTYGVEQNNTFVIESFFTQEDFASMVGATRQWVNKQIKELQKKRVLEIRNRTIVILDLKALEFLAGSSGVSLPNRRVRPTLRVGDDTPISTLLMSRCRLASSAGVG